MTNQSYDDLFEVLIDPGDQIRLLAFRTSIWSLVDAMQSALKNSSKAKGALQDYVVYS